ncbi:MAG: CheR family methyltransferase, partial [Caulobacteraceae bacterium]
VAAIVGVGVCHRSFESFRALFDLIPSDLDAAWVVAVRQFDGLAVKTVLEALSGQDDMPVSVARDGEALAPNHIFVGAPDSLLTIEDGKIRSRATEQSPAERGTVDSLLVSLAEAAHERAVAVVLAGLGSDGTAGVAATKTCGGLALAESIDGESEPAAEAITAAGIADLLIPVDQIAAQIAAYVRNLVRIDQAGGWEALQAEAAGHMSRIAAILRNATGNDFHGYKQNTFLRRVQRRMQVVGAEDVETYIAKLRDDAEEAQHLFQDLLIGVTQFFRDPAEFATLEREVIPKIFEGKGTEGRVRVWAVGCATGEEAYSLAILLREEMSRRESVPQVQVFATDLDARALAIARAGRYPETIAQHLTRERLTRWFLKEGDTYRVSKELRDMVIFSPHNVLKDAPFSRIDLISCRNLLIYLDADLQSRVIPIFHFALAPGGYLFLGNSETILRHQKLFAPVDRKARTFRRLETARRVLPEFPLGQRTARSEERAALSALRRRSAPNAVARRAEAVAEHYAPAYVVTDAQGEVLHFSGRTGRYLEPAAGAANLSLPSLVRRELRLDLRSALAAAADKRTRVETPRIQIRLDGRPASVGMAIEPIGGEEDPLCMLVVFLDGAAEAKSEPAGEGTSKLADEHVRRLEAELRSSNERLQSTIEELESTNEELKSSNEEYQSINEELQSANEELETSKEELQSVNEELQTVNHELAGRVGELARANSDLKNLFESTQIATIFLDNELRVRSFTPAATAIFHLVETDVGRPIGHVAARIAYPDLAADVAKVMRTLATAEREIRGSEGDQRYLVRILPYRSIDNFIAGVVVNFLDITAASRAEAALSVSEAKSRLILESSTDHAIITIEADGRISGWNPGAENLFGWSPAEAVGRQGDFILTGEDRARHADQTQMAETRRSGRARAERWYARKDGGRFWGAGAMNLMANDGAEPGFLTIISDRTVEREAEDRQRMLLAELQHRVRNSLAVVRAIARLTGQSSQSVAQYAASLDGRVNALARAQAAVTRDTSGLVDLGELVGEELASYSGEEEGRIAFGGPAVRLRPKAAESMSLAVHELATNAAKHGGLAGPEGRVDVSWRIDANGEGERRLHFQWREAAQTITGERPERRGFGSTLLERTLAYDLRAETTLAFEPGELICEIAFPLLAEPPIEDLG